jgi:flagellin
MVALQTLKNTNDNLAMVQSEIATGRRINTASDNSAIWAVSKVMEFDVAGYEAIEDGLGMAEAAISVAMAAGEQVIEILNEMKSLAAGGISEAADFAKIEADLLAREAQVTAITSGAQFNGVNLLSDDVDGNGATSLTVLSSIDRSGANNSAGANAPTVTTISVTTADFVTDVDLSGRTNVADVTSADTAIDELETFLQFAVEGVAALGAAKARVELQRDFISKTVDAMETGISTLVDADMEEASARLQAMQTQQQLGIQALSIANQGPQALLQLFR